MRYLHDERFAVSCMGPMTNCVVLIERSRRICRKGVEQGQATQEVINRQPALRSEGILKVQRSELE